MAEQSDWDEWREGIIGLGERSSRKSYYPELQQRLNELEQTKAFLAATNRQLEGVNELQQSLLETSPFEAKLAMVTDGVVKYFGADFCRIWIIRPGDRCADCVHADAQEAAHRCRQRERCLHLLASSGRYTHTDGRGHSRVPIGCYKIGKIASGSEHKFFIRDVIGDPHVHNPAWARELGLVAFAGYRLRPPGEESIGVLALFSQRQILPAEDAMLDSLGSAVALMVQQTVAEQALRRANEELETRVAQRTSQLTSANEHLREEIAQREKAEKARDAVELQLRHAQKLEAVGQLAAGIAHEINTPTQFVGDSLSFLASGFESALRVLATYRRAFGALKDQPSIAGLEQEIATVEEAADIAYVEENLPPAFERAKDGLGRIAKLVSAMKEFAHPAHREKEAADLNRALRTTLTIANNEYKYIADVDEDYGDLPLVWCYPSDINQVFLNLIVNAAHAIGEMAAQNGGRGRITVRTAREGEAVCISFSDTGCGIRPEIRDRVFDPFFTTKPVGKGTGQGLAIARSIIVDKHGGALSFESEVGKGTTFTIRLPIEGAGR